MSFLLDTNILLRLLEPSGTGYALVRDAVDRIAAGGVELFYTAQNLVEFWNVCTRPVARNGLGLSVPETDARARIIESQFNFLADNERTHLEWRRLVVAHSVTGTPVHDARLAAAVMVHGVWNILTLNDRDFARYSAVSAVQPAAVLAAG